MDTQEKRLGRGSIVTAVVGIIIAAMMALVAAGPQATAAAGPSGNKPVLSSEFGKAKSHIVGTFGKKGTVTGTFTPRRFLVNKNDKLVAVGKLRATLTKANGTVVGSTAERVRLPVAKAEGTSLRSARAVAPSCEILNLVLGPLDLNLLGLEVHLDRVVLNIVATPGSGNLLGNLLCAVAGLLDGGLTGLLGEVSRILNAILAILRL